MPSRSHIRTITLWIILMDLLCLALGSIGAMYLDLPRWERTLLVTQNFGIWIFLLVGVMLGNYLVGAYKLQHTYSRFNIIVTWIFSLLFAMLFLTFAYYAWRRMAWFRGVLAYSLAGYGVLALTLKLLVYKAIFRGKWFTCKTVIIGHGPLALRLKNLVESKHVLPTHRVIAYIRMNQSPGDQHSVQDGISIVDAADDTLEDIVRSLGAKLILIGMDNQHEASSFYQPLKRLRFDGIEVLPALQVEEVYRGRIPLDLIDAEYLMQASLASELPIFRQTKNMIDRLLASLASLVLLPIILIVALIMKVLEPKHPVFYLQTRVGRFGRHFKIIKFRTMRPDAESQTGAVWARENDPRITPIGRILRRYRLDEIPQLLNIIKGEMSIVGPRPERPELTDELARRIPFYEERENIIPGLTGWAQIRYPYGATQEDAARKLEYDLYYIRHLSFTLDVQIMLSTFRIVLLGKERSI